MTSLLSNQRFLVLYSGLLTLVFAFVVLTGFTDAGKTARFREITVQRINVVEPDGTLRLIVSNKARSPGIFIKGREHLPDFRKTAGAIFLNDEGTETGGLTFGGMKDKDGNVSTFGHLSFDQYMQDQALTLDVNQENGQRRTALAVIDRPDWPISELIELLERIQNLPPEEQQRQLDEFNRTHPSAQRRVFLGRSEDHSAGLRLRDPQGRDRVVVHVPPDGNPTIQLLDANGNVIGHLP